MKSTSLAVIFIITLLTISQGATLVKAQTQSKDFGETNFNASDGGIFCKIDVTATIQTDPNGDWIKNNTYQVNWFIQITYLNQSIYSADDFSIVCYNPENPIDNTIVQRIINDTTSVIPQKNAFGFLSMTFTPQSAPENFQLDSSFSLKVYYKGNIVTSGSWLQSFNNQPVNINVLNHQTNPSPTVSELSPIALGVALVLVSASIVIYKAKARKNQR